jgi:hypothetical protein
MEPKLESDLNINRPVSIEMQSNGFSSFPQFLMQHGKLTRARLELE